MGEAGDSFELHVVPLEFLLESSGEKEKRIETVFRCLRATKKETLHRTCANATRILRDDVGFALRARGGGRFPNCRLEPHTHACKPPKVNILFGPIEIYCIAAWRCWVCCYLLSTGLLRWDACANY